MKALFSTLLLVAISIVAFGQSGPSQQPNWQSGPPPPPPSAQSGQSPLAPPKPPKGAPPGTSVKLKLGDKAPDFALPNGDGKLVVLSEYTQRSPVVLVFYRGFW